VWAGNGALGFDGDGKPARESRLYWPEDVEFAPDGTPWILDWNNHLIRKVTPDGKLQTVVGSFVGDGPPDLSDLAPPGARGDTVSLNHPTDIQFAPDGTLIFAAWHNHKLRVVNPTTGLVTVMCGRGGGFAGDGVVAGAGSLFNQPKAIVRDPQGAIYILDQRNFRIRKIDPAGMLSTVVGKGTAGFSGDGGPPLEAELRFEAGGNPEPSGALALGPDGALYISDGLNHRIRRVDFVANTINTIAGNGVAGFSGDGGPSLAAQVNNVRDMEFGPDGRLYLADSDNNRIRALDLQAGTIAAVAGTGLTAPALEGKPAAEINLNRPFGVAFDAQGNLYISDTFNSRVLKVTR
jgi:WD40 repeat protein